MVSPASLSSLHGGIMRTKKKTKAARIAAAKKGWKTRRKAAAFRREYGTSGKGRISKEEFLEALTNVIGGDGR